MLHADASDHFAEVRNFLEGWFVKGFRKDLSEKLLFLFAFFFAFGVLSQSVALAKDKGEVSFVGSGVKKSGSLAEIRLACVKQGKKKCKSFQFIHKIAAVQWKVGVPFKKSSEKKLRKLFFSNEFCIGGRGAPDCLRPEFFPIDFRASRILTPFSLTQKVAAQGLNEAIFGTFFADVLMMGVTFPVHSVVALKNSATKKRLNNVVHAWLNPDYDVVIPGSLFDKVLAQVTQDQKAESQSPEEPAKEEAEDQSNDGEVPADPEDE